MLSFLEFLFKNYKGYIILYTLLEAVLISLLIYPSLKKRGNRKILKFFLYPCSVLLLLMIYWLSDRFIIHTKLRFSKTISKLLPYYFSLLGSNSKIFLSLFFINCIGLIIFGFSVTKNILSKLIRRLLFLNCFWLILLIFASFWMALIFYRTRGEPWLNYYSNVAHTKEKCYNEFEELTPDEQKQIVPYMRYGGIFKSIYHWDGIFCHYKGELLVGAITFP